MTDNDKSFIWGMAVGAVFVAVICAVQITDLRKAKAAEVHELRLQKIEVTLEGHHGALEALIKHIESGGRL